MNDFDRMINNLPLLNETELEALAIACQTRVENKKKARREALQRELMSNLRQTISAIIGNDFTLTIENDDNPNWVVRINPDENYSIEIE